MVLCFPSPAGFSGSGSPTRLQKASQWGAERVVRERLGAAFGSDDVISIISGLNTPEKMAQMC